MPRRRAPLRVGEIQVVPQHEFELLNYIEPSTFSMKTPEASFAGIAGASMPLRCLEPRWRRSPTAYQHLRTLARKHSGRTPASCMTELRTSHNHTLLHMQGLVGRPCQNTHQETHVLSPVIHINPAKADQSGSLLPRTPPCMLILSDRLFRKGSFLPRGYWSAAFTQIRSRVA